jgi:hypothetical protein
MARLMLVVNDSVGQRGIIHNPVWVHLLPQRMILPQCVIVHPILVKATLQPALHRVTMEMRGLSCCGREGRDVEHAGVCGVYALVIWEVDDNGLVVWVHVGHWGSSNEKVTCHARVKDNPCPYGGHVDIDSFEECSCSKRIF